MTGPQPVPKQQSQNAKLVNFGEFCKTPRKVETPRQERIQTDGKEKS